MRREWIPLFVITTVAAACLYWFGIRTPEPAPVDDRPEAAIVLPVHPIGPQTDLPREFLWRGPDATHRYRVSVYDQGMNELWAGESGAESLAFPDELATLLRAGQTLFFRVEARTRLGKTLASSEHAFFRLEREPGEGH